MSPRRRPALKGANTRLLDWNPNMTMILILRHLVGQVNEREARISSRKVHTEKRVAAAPTLNEKTPSVWNWDQSKAYLLSWIPFRCPGKVLQCSQAGHPSTKMIMKPSNPT